jgi:hypothetical protein
MRPEDVFHYTRAVPFRPFRMVMNSGQSYEVFHPEMVRVGRTTVFVFVAARPQDPAERCDMVSLVLIERIEFIEVAQSA